MAESKKPPMEVGCLDWQSHCLFETLEAQAVGDDKNAAEGHPKRVFLNNLKETYGVNILAYMQPSGNLKVDSLENLNERSFYYNFHNR